MPASLAHPPQSGVYRSGESSRSARRFPKARSRIGRPRASFSSPFLISSQPPSGGRACWKTGPAGKLPTLHFFLQRAHLNWKTDEIDESARVLLIVVRAHRETGDGERVERIGRLAADRVEIAFVKTHGDLARRGPADRFEKGIERFAQRREPEAGVDQIGVVERE